MTWTKIPDTFNDDPALLSVPRGVRLLYVELTAWSSKHEQDGHVPAYVPARITDEPDVPAALAMLCRTDPPLLESVDGGGWRLPRFADEQMSAAEVKRRRELTVARQQRHRLHTSGDHKQCDARYCYAKRNALQNASETHTERVSNALLPVLPDLSSSEGSGQDGAAGQHPSAGAPGAALAPGMDAGWPATQPWERPGWMPSREELAAEPIVDPLEGVDWGEDDDGYGED